MKKNYDKLTMKFSPCKVPDPCRDYSGYDPCEFCDEITEKDLAILTKEEQAKLERETKSRKSDLRAQNDEQSQLQEAVKSSENKEQTAGTQNNGEAYNKKPCHRDKKQPCKKIERQNPFFKNRLSFSSDLPPPPPIPPPQFFPRVNDSDSKSKICSKRRKKCNKLNGSEGRTRGTGRESGENQKNNAFKCLEEEDNWSAYFKEGEGEDARQNGGKDTKQDEVCRCSYEDQCLENKDFDNILKKRKRQSKKLERFPCKKKVSELSISLQPRQIPPVQRDLPATSPKDIPEVERQILMARENDNEINSVKKKCRKYLDKPK